jgi:uncharacterized protein (DUF2141 family)
MGMAKYFLFLIALLLLTNFSYQTGGSTLVTIHVSGMRNTAGNIRIGIFTSESNFEDDNAAKYLVVPKSGIKNGILTTTVQLPQGTFGLALLDDENTNYEMDYGLILPKEGFGFSNYIHSGWSRPSFDDFKFSVKDQALTIHMKVTYI